MDSTYFQSTEVKILDILSDLFKHACYFLDLYWKSWNLCIWNMTLLSHQVELSVKTRCIWPYGTSFISSGIVCQNSIYLTLWHFFHIKWNCLAKLDVSDPMALLSYQVELFVKTRYIWPYDTSFISSGIVGQNSMYLALWHFFHIKWNCLSKLDVYGPMTLLSYQVELSVKTRCIWPYDTSFRSSGIVCQNSMYMALWHFFQMK